MNSRHKIDPIDDTKSSSYRGIELPASSLCLSLSLSRKEQQQQQQEAASSLGMRCTNAVCGSCCRTELNRAAAAAAAAGGSSSSSRRQQQQEQQQVGVVSGEEGPGLPCDTVEGERRPEGNSSFDSLGVSFLSVSFAVAAVDRM